MSLCVDISARLWRSNSVICEWSQKFDPIHSHSLFISCGSPNRWLCVIADILPTCTALMRTHVLWAKHRRSLTWFVCGIWAGRIRAPPRPQRSFTLGRSLLHISGPQPRLYFPVFQPHLHCPSRSISSPSSTDSIKQDFYPETKGIYL